MTFMRDESWLELVVQLYNITHYGEYPILICTPRFYFLNFWYSATYQPLSLHTKARKSKDSAIVLKKQFLTSAFAATRPCK